MTDEELVNRMVAANRTMAGLSEQGPRPAEVLRAQHPKHHGCVRARFVVADEVPVELRHGVFAQPGRSFAAWVRFSNGRTKDDGEADAHGMAIKLVDVHGPRPEGLDWQTVQDFVLVDDELFFSGKLEPYTEVNETIAAGQDGILARLSFKKAAKLATALQLHGVGDGVLHAIRDFAGQRPASPLKTHYWSTTPYRLGPTVKVKYMARTDQRPTEVEGKPNRDHLRDALRAELDPGRGSGASFAFLVHLHENDDLHPIDDPQVSWSGNGARTVRLATLEIDRQDVALNDELAEKLVFSPWNCLGAHEPLGRINWARKAVYEQLAVERHAGLVADRQRWANGGP